jgi:hypothetical protein
MDEVIQKCRFCSQGETLIAARAIQEASRPGHKMVKLE